MSTRAEGTTGTRVPVSPPTPFTADVLTDVVLERHRQVHLWGHNQDTPDGTGSDATWLAPYTFSGAAAIEESLRLDYSAHAQAGEPLTWVHFLREEVAEAFQEEDPDKLYTELIQVAAVAVSWAEKLRQR